MESGMSGDYRHLSSGSLSIPTGLGPQNGTTNGQPQNMTTMAAGPRFEGPRSPPGKQNTSHVPCKFFRQGACQAGKACPFSHDLASTTDNVCKYFAKGNCKFGPKCANIHVLPDGRRVNYNKNGPIGIGGAHLNIGGRVDPGVYHGQSTLTNSFMRANLTSSPYPSYPGYGQGQEDGFPPLGSRPGGEFGIPTIDTSYANGSNYGSPREDEFMNRAGLGLSPVTNKGLSVLDAPLPSSFDSNGVSWYAKNVSAPMAASVPSKFGFESPPQSLSSVKDGRTSDALQKLRSSAFGDETTRDRFNGIAASPPAAASTEEYFGKRPMHSQRTTKQSIMSASLPKSTYPIDRDWESDFTYEEDFIPDSLQELLTPQEKARRGSRTADDGMYSGAGTPGDMSSKVGSPSNASPSRWGPLFQRQQREEEEKASRTSAFGHVGSPLRNSSLHLGSSPGARASPRSGNTPGDSSPYLASPPRQSSMSIISQQLQRTRLAQSSSAEQPGLHPATATARASNPIGTRREVDRQISSSSIGTGRFTTPIDEEQGDFVFSMEEEDDGKSKRNSGGWNYPIGGRSPHLGGISKGTNGNGNGNSSAGGLDGMFGIGR